MFKKTELSKRVKLAMLGGALLTSFIIAPYAYADAKQVVEANKDSIVPSETPMSLPESNVSPLVMLVMGREHNIFSEAYPDYTDIDGDGQLDIMYDPSITYEGLFESDLCYSYQEGVSDIRDYPTGELFTPKGLWIPSATKPTKKTGTLTMWKAINPEKSTRTVNVCSGALWSGNFLNYVTTSRIDAIKRVLYGGTRLYSTKVPQKTSVQSSYNGSVILKHSHVMRDAHAWGKVLGDDMYENQFTVNDFTGLRSTNEIGPNKAWFFAIASRDNSRWSSNYMRYGLVNDAGMPGLDNTARGAKNFIWDWVSLQSEAENVSFSIASKNIKKSDNSGSLFVDGTFAEKDVLVVACDANSINADHCTKYTNAEGQTVYKPTGVLQKYKENMSFGLISGSWENNTKGGSLRANVGDLDLEIDKYGDFKFGDVCDDTNCYGIINTLDRFAIQQKDDGTSSGYSDSDDKKCTRDAVKGRNLWVNNGTCKDWGNPLGSLLYKTAMYFKGNKTSFTNEPVEAKLNIKSPTYKEPYGDTSDIKYCAKPNALVIADENISFDSDDYLKDEHISVYGSDNIKDEVDKISGLDGSFKKGQQYFVGKNATATSSSYYDYIPSLKTINSLSDVIGIAPTAAFSMGSYNVAGVASLFNRNQSIVAKTDEGEEYKHSLKTYVVAMKPNMPEIKISIGDGSKYVTLLPFAKTTEQSSSYGSDNEKNFARGSSTNQVVDFYVEKLSNNEGVFRINYEDIQYGSDYDMDAIVEYKYQVIKGAKDYYVRIQLKDIEGDGYVGQHAGYVISGVDKEGAYIDLAKSFTSTGSGSYKMPIDNIINDYHLLDNHRDGYASCDTDGKVLSDGCRDYAKIVFHNGDGSQRGEVDETAYKLHINESNVDQWYEKIKNVSYYYLPRYKIAEKNPNANKELIVGDCYRVNSNNQCAKSNEKECVHRNPYDNSIRYNNGQYSSYDVCSESWWQTDNIKRKQRDYTLAIPHTTSRLFRVANTTPDTWLKSPLWYAAKYGLDDKQRGSDGEPSNYFLASNPAILRSGIVKMLEQIESSTHSASSFATESKATSSEDYAYATMYNPSGWWGDVRNAKIDKSTSNENLGGYDYSSFDDAWSLKNTLEWKFSNGSTTTEMISGNTLNHKAPEYRFIITSDLETGELVRLYASEDSAVNKASSDDSESAFKVMNENQSIANAIMGGSYDDSNENNRLFLNRFVRWLAGDHTYESSEHVDETADNRELNLANNGNSPLRERLSSSSNGDKAYFTLGDIINSDVRVFADNVPGTDDGNRVMVVGANDGMLHFIRINMTGKKEVDLQPILSYVPTPALGKIKNLVSQGYNNNHKLFVDSTPQIYKDNSNVIIYGVYGLGLKGGYALNVKDIGKLAANSPEEVKADVKFAELKQMKFLRWELTDKASYAGMIREAPVLAYVSKNDTNSPYLIINSGYQAKKSGIIIVDLLKRNASESSTCLNDGIYTGDIPANSPCIVAQIPLHKSNDGKSDDTALTNLDPWGVGRTNVPTRVTLVDVDSNYKYQAMYWADNFGWVWKVDLDNDSIRGNIACWGGFGGCTITRNNTTDTKTAVDYQPKRIFQAVDSNNWAQPITVRPAVGYHKRSGIGLVIGTGSYFELIDSQTASLSYNSSQSLYMIRDLATQEGINASIYDVQRCNSTPTSTNVKCLMKLDVGYNPDSEASSNRYFEADKNNTIANSNIDYGWYLDLNPVENHVVKKGTGERVYTNPVIFGDSVSVVTNAPAVGNSCDGGGKSYVLQGSLFSGDFAETVHFESLAGNPVLNVYTTEAGEIKTILQVPVDNYTSSSTPAYTMPIEATNPTVRTSSWIRLY